MGNKDGYGGAWFFSLIGKQNLNSIDELKAAMIGKAKFSDPKFSGFYQALADLKKNGYLNSDVASISFTQGLQLFGQKKVAMSWVTDGNVAAAAKALGGIKAMGVGADPDLGQGQARDELRHDAVVVGVHHELVEASARRRRSSSTFLHSPQALKAWYKATGVFPADKRFPASLVNDPIAKTQLKLDQSPRLGLARELRAAAGRRQRRPRGRRADHVGLGLARRRREALGARAREVEEPASGRVQELLEVGHRRLS